MAHLVTLVLVSRCRGVGTRTLVHTWEECHSTTPNRSVFLLLQRSHPSSLSMPPPSAVSLYLFFPPALSAHPLFICTPAVHVHARAHTPGLTLSATTSALHSKALTSETSASTPEDGFIGYSSSSRVQGTDGELQPRWETGAGGWELLPGSKGSFIGSNLRAGALRKFAPRMEHRERESFSPSRELETEEG